jgi:hypothetical protein
MKLTRFILVAALMEESSRSGLATGLLLAGALFIVIGQIRILVLAFRKGVGWGVSCLLVPPVALIFVLLHWDIAGSMLLLELAGFGLLFWSGMLGG